MSTKKDHTWNRALRPFLAGGLILALTACNTTMGTAPAEGIGYRETRFAEISAMREYRKCRDDALELDTQARQQGSGARYLASAKLLETCEVNLGPEAKNIAEKERMRAYALSVQNHLKGGDVAKARENLDRFKSAFEGKDLVYADGSSFTESMEILIGLRDRSDVGEFSIVNVGESLKAELRRVRYWKRN